MFSMLSIQDLATVRFGIIHQKDLQRETSPQILAEDSAVLSSCMYDDNESDVGKMMLAYVARRSYAGPCLLLPHRCHEPDAAWIEPNLLTDLM